MIVILGNDMLRLGYKFICIFLIFFSCKSQQDSQLVKTDIETTPPDSLATIQRQSGRGALLLTRFTSLDELQLVAHMEYIKAAPASATSFPMRSQVCISYVAGDKPIMSILTTGTSESDLLRARTGNLWDKIVVSFKSPYALISRKNLLSIEYLGRRKPWLFGNGDIAFYDLAETMVFNIVPDELVTMPAEDLSGKGYLNTFNHVIAQAFMTSIFSEKFADFVADVHERN
ncbi:MAG: hypothetical protein M3R25_11630, partial [Bacteroidota bacterium]|nr:hypothetical protein [Bacteroidota bacterium]